MARRDDLCGPCGTRLFRSPGAGTCYICRNMLDRLGPLHDRIAGATEGYEFESFMIGVTVRPSVLERDDIVRSRHGLAGAPGIKSDIAARLAARLARLRGARPDCEDPDLTITADTRECSAEVRSRSVVLAGRYTKSSRTMPQRSGPCRACGGSGCGACGLHGIDGADSVEGRMAGYLYGAFSSARVRITWIGGEERGSTVTGAGRPFFARVLCPRRRSVRLPDRVELGGVVLRGLGYAGAVPSGPVRFVSDMRLRVRAERDVSREDLRRLRVLDGSRITIYEGTRRTERRMHAARYRRAARDAFVLSVRLDGGVPVRELVHGETVFPNLSDLLGVRCVCEGYDVYGVEVQ